MVYGHFIPNVLINMASQSKKHKCAACGRMFGEGEISFAPDPYNQEINDDDTNVWECSDCREESRGDI